MQADLAGNPQLFAYLESVSVQETEHQKKLRHQVEHLELATMQISPLQAQFLRFLLASNQPKKCLEIGSYCGYSTMVIAEAITKDGHVHTCDKNESTTRYALEAWQDAGIDHKITLHLGLAVKTLIHLMPDHQNTFDFVFIDADKTSYSTYYLLAKDLLKPGGIIILDNIAWSGKVASAQYNDRQTDAIRHCNQLVAKDTDVISCIIPLGDGMFLAHKK